jgi:hypothetical protein
MGYPVADEGYISGSTLMTGILGKRRFTGGISSSSGSARVQ